MLVGSKPSYSEINTKEPYQHYAIALGRELTTILINYKYCSGVSDCRKKEVMFSEGRNRVYINFYGINDRELNAALVSFVTSKGAFFTDGSPITINFHKEKKKDVLGFKDFLKKSVITLEINE